MLVEAALAEHEISGRWNEELLPSGGTNYRINSSWGTNQWFEIDDNNFNLIIEQVATAKLVKLLVPLVSTFQHEGDHELYRLTVAKERPRLHEKTQGQSLS